MINLVNIKVISSLRKLSLKRNVPYTLDITGGRCIFKSPVYGEYMNEDAKFPSDELSFIKSVKQYVLKNNIHEKIPNEFTTEEDKKKIRYFHYDRKFKPGDVITGYGEVDMKSAYWITSFNEGVIDKKIFDTGNNGLTTKSGKHIDISKKSRLAAIGSLAKRSRKYEYTGTGKEFAHPAVTSVDTEFLWDTICYKTGNVMAAVMEELGDDFGFFWVDAMFVKKEAIEKVKKLFKKYGYESSVYNCEEISFHDRKIVVKSKDKGKWVKRRNHETKKMERIWTDLRPFPYQHAFNAENIIKHLEDSE